VDAVVAVALAAAGMTPASPSMGSRAFAEQEPAAKDATPPPREPEEPAARPPLEPPREADAAAGGAAGGAAAAADAPTATSTWKCPVCLKNFQVPEGQRGRNFRYRHSLEHKTRHPADAVPDADRGPKKVHFVSGPYPYWRYRDKELAVGTFQVTVGSAHGDKDVAERVLRKCYSMAQGGATKEMLDAFAKKELKRLGPRSSGA